VGHDGVKVLMKVPIWLPAAGAGTHVVIAVHEGSAQSVNPSPLLSTPSRQSVSGFTHLVFEQL